MKKKVLVLTLAMAVLMTACGGQGSTEEPVEEVMETEEVEEETPAEEVEEVADYVKGISNETGYESEWIGLRFTAPEGASMMSEEELNEIMGLGQDVLSEDFNDLQLKYAEMSTVSEMMCTTATGTPNVVITAERMVMDIDLDQYVEAMKQTFAQVTTMTYTVGDTSEVVSIGGIDFRKVAATADYEGVIMNQDFYVMLQGDRVVSIALTYTEETKDAADAMLGGFAAY